MDEEVEQQYVFEQLSRRLADLTEALFERAPYCRGRFQGAGTRLAALCCGPAAAESVLREFEERWPFLLDAMQRSLRDEWEIGLLRLLHSVKEPCGSCSSSFGISPLIECPNCAQQVATVSEDLEAFAQTFADKLEYDPLGSQTVQESEASQDQDERVQALERECQSYKESLEEIQKALEDTSNENAARNIQLEELEKAKTDLQTTCRALESELRETIDNLEKVAEDLDIGMRWGTAQTTYAALHKHILAQRERMEPTPANEQVRKDMILKSLGFKHKQITALMKLGQYTEAEPMAKQVWDERRSLLNQNDKETRAAMKDYCDILRRNGRHDVAEREYMYMYYALPSDNVDTDETEWKLDTMTRIGEVMAEQGKYSYAALWHKRVLELRLLQTPLEVDKAAAAAAQCLSCQKQQELGYTVTDSTIVHGLEVIWSGRRPGHENENVLICGHELGDRLMTLARDDEAAPILMAVWEKRKAAGEHPEAIAAALSLVDLSVKTENVARLETLYHWIYMNPAAGQSENDRLWYRYRLGCVQAVLEKPAVAEDTLRKALARQTELFGVDDPDTLQYTQVLAEVVRRQGRTEEAKNLAKSIWDRRERHPRSYVQAVSRIGHLYGDIAMESNAADELKRAEAILREVWDSTSTNMAMMNLSSLVTSGDCFGQCLMKRGKFAEAKNLLEQVAEWKKWLGLDPGGNRAIDESVQQGWGTGGQEDGAGVEETRQAVSTHQSPAPSEASISSR